MAREPPVHPNNSLIVRGRPHLIHIEPGLVAFGLTNLALAEEENIDDDIRAGVAAKAAFGQADRCDQVGAFRDCVSAWRLTLPSAPKSDPSHAEKTAS